jgi:hypothetical protein
MVILNRDLDLRQAMPPRICTRAADRKEFDFGKIRRKTTSQSRRTACGVRIMPASLLKQISLALPIQSGRA